MLNKKSVLRTVSSISIFFLLSQQANAYGIIFQDDDFGTIESESLILGSNDSGTGSNTIQFGSNPTAALNGNIKWDIGDRTFKVDHSTTVTNTDTTDSFRVNDEAADTTPFLIDENGNTAIGSDFFDPTNPEKLKVDAGVTSSYNIISGYGDTNSYLQLNIRNRNSGDSASSDIVATSDTGNDTVNYIDMGINSSGYSNAAYSIGGPNDGYLYAQGVDSLTPGGNLIIGTGTEGKVIKFHTGGTTAADEKMRIDGDGNVGIGTTSPSATLHITPATADALKIDPYGLAAGNTGNLELMELAANGTNHVGFKAPDSIASNVTWTLPSADGSAGYALVTDGTGNLSWSSAIPHWQRTGTLLEPVTAGDSVSTTGNIYTTGTGTITSAGLLTGNLGLTASGAAINLNNSSNFNTSINTGTSTGGVSIGNSAAGAITVTSGTGNALTLTGGTASSFNTTSGNITLQPAGTGTTAYVTIGNDGAGSTTPDLLVLDVKSDAGDPATGTDGAMYYSENTNKFRCHVNGSWSDCDTTGGTVNLQSAYNNGATVTTAGSTDIGFNLTSGNFTASGAGSVNLTPTSASSFTSGGTLTLTGGAASTWGTTSGDLTLQAAGTGTTANVRVGTGGAGSGTPDLLGLDVKNTVGDPTGYNGAMYYNAFSNAFRCYENGGWKDCGATGTGAATLQQAYTAGNTISTTGTNIGFTLNGTDQFTASGAGSINLTPTGASSFTSGGALTLTGGAASTWGTTAGALTLQAAGSGTTSSVHIGSGGAGSTTPDLLGLDVKSDAGDPAGYNGAMYYNANSNRFRCYENGAWKNCDISAITTLQGAYDNGNTITTSGSTPISFSLASGDLNVSGAGATNINPTGGVSLGSATSQVNLPGLSASLPVFTDSSKNLTSSGVVPLNQGGTGQTTKTTAFDALSPATIKGDLIVNNGTNNVRLPVSGTNGWVLMSDSSQVTGVKWASVAGTGTVTSVDASGGTTGLTFSGGPIITSGVLTMGGILSLNNGGTNNSLTANNGGVVYSDATRLQILPGTPTAGKILQSGISAAPSWSIPTYPSASGSAGQILRSNGTNNLYSTALFADTYAASNLLFSNGANNVQGLATANNGILVTDGTGVPSIGSYLPIQVTLTQLASDPLTCTAGQQYFNTTTATVRLCNATNTWTGAGPSGTQYFFAYDTTTQTVGTAGTFQDVTFSANAQIDGWTHTPGTASFVANVTGTYMANVVARVAKSGGANTSVSVIATKNGSEITGSQSYGTAAAASGDTMSGNFIFSVAAGDTIKIRLTGGTSSVQILPGGDGTTKPSIQFNVWRMK